MRALLRGQQANGEGEVAEAVADESVALQEWACLRRRSLPREAFRKEAEKPQSGPILQGLPTSASFNPNRLRHRPNPRHPPLRASSLLLASMPGQPATLTEMHLFPCRPSE